MYGRDVALVELHPLGELQLHAEGLAFLDVDDAVLADLLDRVGNHVADLIVTGGDGGDTGDLLLAGDLLGLLLAQGLDHVFDRGLDPAAQGQRVGAGGDVLEALADDDLGQQGRRRGAVTGDVVGRRGDLADELGALVLEDVLDLDLAGDGDAVVGDRRRAELFVEHDVTALRAEGDLDRVGNSVDAGLQGPPCFLAELQLLMSHVFSVLLGSSKSWLGGRG